MINAQMRKYDYYTIGDKDRYGQPVAASEVKGQVKMSINLMSEALNENTLYSGAQYVGLTFDDEINAKYIIQYGEEKLKVLYVNPHGRYKQVFLARM